MEHERLQAATTVLVTLSNAPYIDFLDNWLCHVASHNLKALVVATDVELMQLLNSTRQRGQACPLRGERLNAHAFVTSIKVATRRGTGTGAASFFGGSFYDISNAKLNVVLAILQLGINAWFADPDVAFVRDPWPTFRLRLPCDYAFAYENEKDEKSFHLSSHSNPATLGGGVSANTGFHKFSSNDRTLRLVSELVLLARLGYGADDQTNLWWLLTQPRWLSQSLHVPPARSSSLEDPSRLVTANARGQLTLCGLPRSAHLSCYGGKHHPTLPRPKPATYHANCVQGRANKINMMKIFHLWLLDKNATHRYR